MARSKEAVKPLFDVKGDFTASLDRFVHESGMLRDAVQTMLQMGKVPDAVRSILEERVKALDVARTGRVDSD